MVDFKTEAINSIVAKSMVYLNVDQQQKLQDTLDIVLHDYDLFKREDEKQLPATIIEQNQALLTNYLVAKGVESLSKTSLELYRLRLLDFIETLDKPLNEVTSNEIRYYLAYVKQTRKVSNTTLEGIRLVLSSFFSWLNNEGYIKKNPVSTIKSIKKDSKKELPFNPTEIESMRNVCDNLRDRALLEFMLSTGCRLSEICSVNRDDIDFVGKELIVTGKGNKQRLVYLSDLSLYHIQKYLESRTDFEEALFVTTKKPYNRISRDGLESVVKKWGAKAGIEKVHPHRFRRTFCCENIYKGMPLENMQTLMGHSKMDTTLIYYNISNDNVKKSFQAINN